MKKPIESQSPESPDSPPVSGDVESDSESGIFGFMAETVIVYGDVTEPTGEIWEGDR